MATGWTWEYGAEGTGLHFTITYDIATETFTVKSLEGSFDLNALWWDNGADDNIDISLTKSDSSLNMNGSGADDWDGYMKVSNPGLGVLGEGKDSFISEGETDTFSLADFGLTGAFNPKDGGTLGVRATSVNGSGSIKLVDDEPVPTDDKPNDFPKWGQDISHIVLYFKDDGTTIDNKPKDSDGPGPDTPGDGYYLVKIDDWDDQALLQGDDLDDYIDAILSYLVTSGQIAPTTDLLGVAIKGGIQPTQYYAYGDHNSNGTDPDLVPVGAPLIETPPPHGDVDGPNIDLVVDYDTVFA